MSAYDPKQTLAYFHLTPLVDASGIQMPLGRLEPLQFLPKIGSRNRFLRGQNEEVRIRQRMDAGRRNMKTTVVAALIAIWCVPSATFAGERVGDAALGALSGAVVLGPVGAVAGVVIGYTAGPSIADSWGLKRSDPRQSAKLRANTTSKRVTSTQANPSADFHRDVSVPTPPVRPSVPSDGAKVPINGLEM
jgi:hypothetical protein